MASNYVRLKVITGSMDEVEYVFDSPAVCLVGRGKRCFPLVPPSPWNMDVSRRHCVLSIVPPRIWIKDLGSLNGTFVNGLRLKCGDGPSELVHLDKLSLANSVLFEIETPCSAAVPTKIASVTALQRGPQCFEVQRGDKSLTIRFKGRRVDLTMDHLRFLRDYLTGCVRDSSCNEAVLDFSNVENMASVTLGQLVRIHQELSASGLPIRLVGVLPHIYEILEVSNLHEIFDIRQAKLLPAEPAPLT